MIKDLNVRLKTIKILEEKIGSKISDMSRSNSCFCCISTKEKKGKKWDYITLKSFCTAKTIINKIKRQTTEWEFIFADTSDKVLIPKSYITEHQKKTNNPIKAWAKDQNSHFSKEDIQMANRHMKRCSTFLTNHKRNAN